MQLAILVNFPIAWRFDDDARVAAQNDALARLRRAPYIVGMNLGHDPIIGVILAGGSARRMFRDGAGGDKGLIELAGLTMLERVRDRIAPQVSHLILNANGDVGRFAHLGLEVVGDDGPGDEGPLAGLAAAFHWMGPHAPGHAVLLTVATDTPFLPRDLVRRLQAERKPDQVALAASGGRVHPVIGIWPVTVADDVKRALADGQRSVEAFAKSHNAVAVSFPYTSHGSVSLDPFFNANTPDDLAAARKLLATGL